MPADNQITIYGLYHLSGLTASAYIGGIDCGDYTVAADGSIVVPYGSDIDGNMTPDYLINLSGTYGGSNHDVTFNVNPGSGAVSVTVPVLVGLNYTSQGQILRPLLGTELKLQTGQGLGITRQGYEYSLLCQNCVTLEVGTDFSTTLAQALFTTDGGRTPELAIGDAEAFTGVHWGILQDDYTFDGQICWQIARPSPGTINAAGIFIDNLEDR